MYMHRTKIQPEDLREILEILRLQIPFECKYVDIHGETLA